MKHSVRSARLVRYPGGAGDDVFTIDATVERAVNGVLAATYRVQGDMRSLRLAPAAPPRFAEGLWRHTCFELFLRCRDAPAYYEFNFAPSGEWAVYAFERYRQGRSLEDESLAPRVATQSMSSSFELEVTVPLHSLTAFRADGALALAVSVVLEDTEGALSYWALAHPCDKPDFHHPDAFTLQLDEIRN